MQRRANCHRHPGIIPSIGRLGFLHEKEEFQHQNILYLHSGVKVTNCGTYLCGGWHSAVRIRVIVEAAARWRCGPDLQGRLNIGTLYACRKLSFVICFSRTEKLRRQNFAYRQYVCIWLALVHFTHPHRWTCRPVQSLSVKSDLCKLAFHWHTNKMALDYLVS